MPRRLLLLALALAACEAAGDDAVATAGNDRPPAQAAAPDKPRPMSGRSVEEGECALTVAFGSYAMGIDRPTFTAVEALLTGDSAVISVDSEVRGREGETLVCAQVRSNEDAERLFRRIADSLPANPRGPIRVATATGLRAEAPPSRR